MSWFNKLPCNLVLYLAAAAQAICNLALSHPQLLSSVMYFLHANLELRSTISEATSISDSSGFLHIQQLLFTSLWAVISTVRCQLSNGTNYQKEEYGKISRKYWVVLCECVVSAQHLTSSWCIAHSAGQFWAILPSFFNKMVADASDFGKNGIDWSFRSSKPVEKV